MLNNSHKNPDCGHAEELVSYLYGERNAAFEAHLKNCAACAGELEAFAGVQFAINDWKLKEFAPLKTPVIEISYEKAGAPSSVNSSWLTTLRDLFAVSSRTWSLTAASVAVFVACVGIVLFALFSDKRVEVTQNNKNTKTVVSPANEKPAPESSAHVVQNQQRSQKATRNDAPQPTQPEVVVAEDATPKNTRAVKISNNQRPAQKADALPKNSGAKRDQKNRNAPKILNDEEDEDDSLRLAELFEEIGTE